MRKVVCLVCLTAVAVFTAASAYAQSPIKGGQVEVAGTTALSFTRDTVTPKGGKGVDNNITSLGLGLVYYVTPMIGIGVGGTYQNLSLTDPSSSDKIEASTGAVGPTLKLRFGVGDKTAVYVSGSGGIAKTHLKGSQSATGTGDTDGKFWAAGGGLNFFIVDAVSFNLGVQYQKTKLTKGSNEADTSGFVVAVGFSMYFGSK